MLSGLVFGQAAPVANVYVMPMSGGFDQYLAGHLTKEHIMPVVADPKSAGIVLTDRLGEAFEARLTQIMPLPKPEADTDKDSASDNAPHPAFQGSARRGTFFMVDAKTRQVLWSGYFRPVKNPTPDNLNRQAAQIAKDLKTTYGK